MSTAGMFLVIYLMDVLWNYSGQKTMTPLCMNGYIKSIMIMVNV